MSQPRITVFAAGTKTGGGSGAENLVVQSRDEHPMLEAEIVAFVSNHAEGGVHERAKRLQVPFIHFPKPWDEAGYNRVMEESGGEWAALSGWLKLVVGLDPRRTFNIHPASLSLLNGRFGGAGMYGHHVHEAVAEALAKGEITDSGVSMHFVTSEYDRGPVFFEERVPLTRGMTAEEIGKAVNSIEHKWQPRITSAVVNGQIYWDGTNVSSLRTPLGYPFLPPR